MPRTTDSTTTDTESSSQANAGMLLSGAFGVLLVLMLVTVLIMTSGQGPPPAKTEHPSAPPAVTAPPGPDQGPSTVPTSAPTDVSWQLFHTAALPSSRTAGPRTVTDSLATGFVHTPTGALMAAIQIPIRKIVAPDWAAVVDRQIVPGPGADAYRQARAPLGTNVEPEPGQFGQVTGFKFVNYTPDTATIQLVSRFVSGAMQATTITVQWQGDWKLLLQPDGGDSPTAQPVTDLSTYILWGGV